jgi:hypothetical protein
MKHASSSFYTAPVTDVQHFFAECLFILEIELQQFQT